MNDSHNAQGISVSRRNWPQWGLAGGCCDHFRELAGNEHGGGLKLIENSALDNSEDMYFFSMDGGSRKLDWGFDQQQLL